MIINLTISAADASKQGVPTALTYDLGRPLLSEIRALRIEVGWNWKQFTSLLVLSDEEATAVLAWLAARRAGCTTPYGAFELDMAGLDVQQERGGDAQAGKAPTPTSGDSVSAPD